MKQKLSREDRRKAWLYALLIVLGLILLAALILWARTWEIWEAKGSLPPTGQAVLDAAQGLDDITVDARLDPDARTLAAVQTLRLRNRTGRTQTAAVLRSYSGAYLSQDTSPAATEELFAACYGETFSAGGLILDGASVNGEKVAASFTDDARTVLTLPLATPWASGETIEVSLQYHVDIPACRSRFGADDSIIALGNVFPLPAVWQDGAYRTDAYISIGDPFLSECANWVVRLTVPAGYAVASSAWNEPARSGDTDVYTLEAQAVRDFALVVGKDLATVTGMAGDTMLIACAENRATARSLLTYARQALACYEKHYGDYVYPTLTLAQVHFPYGGMEYPRLVMIGTDAMADAETLETTVAHETAHQWWYAQVGSDPWYQAWQDESLCEYATIDYLGDVYGSSARDSAVFRRVETAMRITIPRGVTPGSPIDYFSDLSEYTQVVYRRGAALWLALETNLGKDALDSFLQTYQARWRFRLATRADLTALLTEVTGRDLSGLLTDYLDTEMN